MAAGNRMTTYLNRSAGSQQVNVVTCRDPSQQVIHWPVDSLNRSMGDLFLIPVRVVRRAARFKGSAPLAYRSLGVVPTPPRPPRSSRKRSDERHLKGGKPSICGLGKSMEGSGGGESPPAAGGGPQPITEGGCATRPGPTCGARGAGALGAPRQPCTTRKVTTARKIQTVQRARTIRTHYRQEPT